jgi:Protein of unknown function (DUF1194)
MKLTSLSSLPTKLTLGTIGAIVALGVFAPKSFAITLVDSELFLSVDVSGSISNTEFTLQRTGYVNAFQDPTIHNQIASLPNGLAVALGYWSSANQQNVAVPWTLITNATQSNAFADLIAATTRPYSGGTSPGEAIQFATNQLLTNDFQGRKIIDVSGDGAGNTATTLAARNAAFAQGITINGLPIGGAAINTFYQNNVVTTDGFLIAANDFGDFDAAVKQKIGREIVDPSIPTPALLPGIIGLGATAWRKRRNAATAEA